MVGRAAPLVLAAVAALGTAGAGPVDPGPMLRAFDRVATAMVYAGAGLTVFAIVWAGFLLMAEGSEERGTGRIRAAVFTALLGLVVVLTAKALALALRSQLFPVYPGA